MNAKRLMMGAIGYELGEHVEELEDNMRLHEDRKSQLFLRSMGFGNYHRTERSLGELSAVAIKKTLSKYGHRPDEIDLLIFSSSTFGDRHGDVIDKDLAACLIECDLGHVYPLGVYLSQCNNFFAALDITSQYLKSGMKRKALLVFCDKVLDESTRFKNLAVNSDAAVACIVSTEEHESLPFELKSISTHSQITVKDLIDPVSNQMNLDVHENYLDGIRKVSAEALDSAQTKLEELKHVICHNFSFSALRQIAATVGTPESSIYKGNIGRFGHAYTCDSLINLDSCYQENITALPASSRVAVIGTGLYFWGMAVLSINKPRD
ncbi:3-oxoacyl-ACP synthase [Pseudomonas savastanoi]|uniref:3-oxoacyl-synthase III protein n=1 Tax=Pseudomonas savastanoi TaxID=29438 RepID=A0A3M6B3R7_PSESS|nr:3-oxoacyl-ACP synthase [Pseudomonas savastanoi]KPX01596.1 3-oxoacyl- synthase III family protein [Pseudomonas syringae pv. cunninghamiae]RMV20296.1 3-oxoacyl- synthase III protein [Pseudomonas savastanoi]RMV26173.1 3-oxoacyl- synthase III protein [Pseudomonas savastanoi]